MPTHPAQRSKQTTRDGFADLELPAVLEMALPTARKSTAFEDVVEQRVELREVDLSDVDGLCHVSGRYVAARLGVRRRVR